MTNKIKLIRTLEQQVAGGFTPQIEALLSPEQTAAMIQVKPNTLAKWRVTGEGPAFVHIGRAVRYHPRELARYIEHQTRRSTSEASTGGGRGYHNNDPL